MKYCITVCCKQNVDLVTKESFKKSEWAKEWKEHCAKKEKKSSTSWLCLCVTCAYRNNNGA